MAVVLRNDCVSIYDEFISKGINEKVKSRQSVMWNKAQAKNANDDPFDYDNDSSPIAWGHYLKVYDENELPLTLFNLDELEIKGNRCIAYDSSGIGIGGDCDFNFGCRRVIIFLNTLKSHIYVRLYKYTYQHKQGSQAFHDLC